MIKDDKPKREAERRGIGRRNGKTLVAKEIFHFFFSLLFRLSWRTLKDHLPFSERKLNFAMVMPVPCFQGKKVIGGRVGGGLVVT